MQIASAVTGVPSLWRERQHYHRKCEILQIHDASLMTKTVEEKIYMVGSDFFIVDSRLNIRRENWTKAIHGYIDMYCKLPT